MCWDQKCQTQNKKPDKQVKPSISYSNFELCIYLLFCVKIRRFKERSTPFLLNICRYSGILH